MNSLLHGKFEPITASIGLIKAPLSITTEDFLRWGNEALFKYGQSKEKTPLRCGLNAAFNNLLPLVQGSINRQLLLAIGSQWTAYFDNGWRGSDPDGVAAVMSRRLHTTTIRLTRTCNTLQSTYGRARGTYGATIFEVWEASQTSRRSIACANDGGRWVFEQRGEPYAFEDLPRYQNRRLADRFPPELLEKYVEQFGVNPFSEASYLNERNEVSGFLIEKKGNLPKTLKNIELSEARHALGLE
ncbi:MAG TPA: hypothetical protein VGI03_10460 [Verrucomicrobiae bacterium]|jgi:hypothetical protein